VISVEAFGGLHFPLISFSKFPNSFFSKRGRIACVCCVPGGRKVLYLCVLTCVFLMEAGCGWSGRVGHSTLQIRRWNRLTIHYRFLSGKGGVPQFIISQQASFIV
jgi:hypothetical protein